MKIYLFTFLKTMIICLVTFVTPIKEIEELVMIEWVKTLVNPEAMELQPIKEEEVIKTINY